MGSPDVGLPVQFQDIPDIDVIALVLSMEYIRRRLGTTALDPSTSELTNDANQLKQF